MNRLTRLGLVADGPRFDRYRVPDGFELVSLGAWHHIHQRDADMVGVAITEHALGFFAAGHPGLELLARCATRIDGRPVEVFLGRWGREDAPVYEILAEWFDPVDAGTGHLRVELHEPDPEALLDLRPVIWSVRVRGRAAGSGQVSAPPASGNGDGRGAG